MNTTSEDNEKKRLAEQIASDAVAFARANLVGHKVVEEWVVQFASDRRVSPIPALRALAEAATEPMRNWHPSQPVSDDERLEIAFARLQAQGISARFGTECCTTCFPREARRRNVRDAACWAQLWFHPWDTRSLDNGFLDLVIAGPPCFEDELLDEDDWNRAYRMVTGELTTVGLTWEWEAVGLPLRVTNLTWSRLPVE